MNRITITRREWLAGALGAAALAGSGGASRDEGPLESLRAWLKTPEADRPPLADQPFATAPLSKADAGKALAALADDRDDRARRAREGELESGQIVVGDKEMPVFFKAFGDAPPNGHSLWISMHGGGNAPPRVNDRQWENQKKLYALDEGIYVAPRAPTNTWDLWHQGHIDGLFDRLIDDMVLFQGVDRDRVYLFGYSAGGDGVYQLAPRMSDRFAAAAMMAGHPNETKPTGLRNLPFALQVGGDDGAYKRNEVARAWGDDLKQLHEADPGGYPSLVKIHEGKGHWMGGEDRLALPWMAKFRRNTTPDKVVWLQDDVTHDRFYWLAVPPGEARPGSLVVAKRDGQTVTIQEAENAPRVVVRLNDRLIDLDRPVKVVFKGKIAFEGPLKRTVASLASSLEPRGDRALAFSAEVVVDAG